MSQETAAEIVGISDRTLRNIERCRTHTEMNILFRLCDLYGVPILEITLFYTRDENMTEAVLLHHIHDAHVTEGLTE